MNPIVQFVWEDDADNSLGLPLYATSGAAGADLKANLANRLDLVVKPGARALISTGLRLAISPGFEVQIRPRSGLALKYGITLANSPGTIDSDYRGEIGILLINLSNENFEINNGDRIAQMVLSKYEVPKFVETSQISVSQRGEDGFGSTGKK